MKYNNQFNTKIELQITHKSKKKKNDETLVCSTDN